MGVGMDSAINEYIDMLEGAMEISETWSIKGEHEVISAFSGVFREDVPKTVASEQRSHQGHVGLWNRAQDAQKP